MDKEYSIMELDNTKARLEGMRRFGEPDNCNAINVALDAIERMART